jgi:hypothetical protein
VVGATEVINLLELLRLGVLLAVVEAVEGIIKVPVLVERRELITR